MTPPLPTSPDALLAETDWVRSLAARLAFDGAQGSDLEQEIWRAALERPPAADVPLRPWLCGVAVRLVLMARRTTARRRQREQRVPAAPVPPTADLVAQVELQQRLLAAVHALPEAMREVVLLRFYEGLPPRAIARRLGVPINTVRTRLQRAKERLRAALDAGFGDRSRWVLASVVFARPQHLVAGAGATAVVLHCALILMHGKQALLVGGALALLVTVPMLAVLTRGGPPAPPDYSRSTPVASLFDRSSASATPDAGPQQRLDVGAPSSAAALLGKVVDQNGTPIAGVLVLRAPAWVHRLQIEAGRAARADVETRTSADGSFALPAARGEVVQLAAQHEQYVARAEETECVAGAPTTIVMLRTHEVPLVVEVVDRSTRTPAPRFRVDGISWWRSSGTNDGPRDRQLSAPDDGLGTEGVFRGTARFVEGLPLQLRIDCRGHGRGEWDDGTDALPWRDLEPLPGVPLHVVVEVELGAAERLAPRVQRGRVLDATDGRPIAGASLAMQVDGQQRWTRSVQSAADGSFVIAMPKDGADGTVLVEHDDYQTEARAAQPETEFALRLVPRATFRCRVVGGHGEPLRGAPILFRVRGHGVHQRLRTDDDGTFTVRKLLADRYHVFLLARPNDADDHAIAHGSWSVSAGTNVDVVLHADPPDVVRVIGTVTGAGPGMVPAFVPHAGDGRWVVARPVGSGYDAGGLQRGIYLVAIVPADDGRRDVPIHVLPRVVVDGLGTVVCDLQAPTGIVSGRLVTSHPAEGLRVVLIPDVPVGGPAAELVASEKFLTFAGGAVATDGTFVLPRVADGTHRLEVRAGERVLASRHVSVQGSADVGSWQLDR